MRKPTVKLYGMSIHVGSRLGTKICIMTDSNESYITMSQDIYDLMVIACAKIDMLADGWVDDQLTRPRDDLFRSLANKEFYWKLIGIVGDLRREVRKK